MKGGGLQGQLTSIGACTKNRGISGKVNDVAAVERAGYLNDTTSLGRRRQLLAGSDSGPLAIATASGTRAEPDELIHGSPAGLPGEHPRG